MEKSKCKTPKKHDKERTSNRLSRSQTPSLKALENLSPEISQNRRSLRKPSPSKRYNENEYEVKISNRKRRTVNYRENDISDEGEEEDNESIFFDCANNTAPELFNEDLDVAGKNIYGFSTPRKKDALLKVVNNTPRTPKTPISPKTPKTPKTPKVLKTPKTPGTHKGTDKKRSRLLDTPAKTPSRIRSKVKKEIAKQIQESSEEDFSVDESEYSPSEDESDSAEEDDENYNAFDQEKHNREINLKRMIAIPILPKTPGTRRSNRLLTKEYIPEAEEYFTTHANKKIITSDHTLDRLKNPRLAADRLFTILSSMTISPSHEKAITNLFKEYQNDFSKWMILLNEGFNIICYGLGSKRKLLQSFHKEMLADRNVLVINGFFPSLTIKDILDGIITDILSIANVPGSPHEAVDLIEEQFAQKTEDHLFLIVHNIDGLMLRSSKAQEILSRLGRIAKIHLITSIDHINAPLLWDNIKLSNYNFLWWDTTTMLPYTDETAFENSLMVQNTSELALSSMRSVFLSLTTNSRGIYMLIVKYQLTHSKIGNYQGMSFKDLYHTCRETFLVSSDLALRAQLTEFLDHKLVRNKRSIDGTEFLQIPISSELLQQFINEQEN